ncbi:aspartate carbamoyltransferase catalytic subunit [Legionella jordanis]|uniref:Aspartate carbamoyltransferase n=1 Tax=Legionella jordanis TaxID=456 RepID=A0A0W0VE16_9GAMM|nr:aspartate carbamoyltransferase catalytic subunit [Legionella jordanis]KTD18346.1 aspartate carbamoyltransferase [Legionella jordanis]RMX05257.1 aspartate carbamoyltransferase catalytic subunit [Legionella jordanis]RMX20892.1 aspartate carbamoyltransferase catalytic subunit [Legionella jordanis]VEH13308.1 aspartate carbamoyltransferase [Legionella jordanis]
MNHFLEISQCSKQYIEQLLHRALQFKQTKVYPDYSSHTVANLFYENSTRTRVSFELAAKKLGLTVINLDLQSSSEAKGEIIEDTLQTLIAMGIDLFVIRHSLDGLPQDLAKNLADNVHLINAGDGKHAHPSQAMLDLMTIYEQKPNLAELKVAIVGNLRHSRVANSLQCLCSVLGINDVRLIAPDIWQPLTVHHGRVSNSLEEGLNDADVVIGLRVQKERLQQNEEINLETYRKLYALTQDSLKYAKPNAMIMHPGPLNRGVEIDSDVADGSQSFILQQVSNGVFMRMAIIESLIQSLP